MFPLAVVNRHPCCQFAAAPQLRELLTRPLRATQYRLTATAKRTHTAEMVFLLDHSITHERSETTHVCTSHMVLTCQCLDDRGTSTQGRIVKLRSRSPAHQKGPKTKYTCALRVPDQKRGCSLPCEKTPMTMTMNDHSSQLPVNKALTCPEGQSAGAVASPWLAKEIRSVQKDEVVRSLRSVKEFRSDLLPLGIKRSCIGVGRRCVAFSMSMYDCLIVDLTTKRGLNGHRTHMSNRP